MKPRLYVLAVGVSDYRAQELTLRYAAKDAGDFAQAMQAQKGGLYHYHKLTTQTAAAIAQVQEASLPKRMTLVGWAFDGFPVYWKYGQLKQGGELITMKSGWKLRKARYAASGGSPMIRSSLSVLLSTTTSTR